MKQNEFDKRMRELNIAESLEKAPLAEALNDIYQRKRTICHEMDRLNIQLSEIKAERYTLEKTLKQIGAKYWQMKHDLIVDNPKV